MTAMRWTLLLAVVGAGWLIYGLVSLGGDDGSNTGAFITGAAFLIGSFFSYQRLER